MDNLTPEQKLENIKKHLQQSEISPNLPITEVLGEINDSLKALIDKETPEVSMPDVCKVEIQGAEVVTIKGDKGDRGEKGDKGDKGDSIKGDQGVQGPKGDNGDKGDQGEKGERGDGVDGKDGKDGSPDTGDQIIGKINASEEQIDKERIKGLEDEIKELRNTIESLPKGRGGFKANNATKFHDLSSLADGATKIFNVPKGVAGIVLCSDFPTVLMEGNGFTINATRTQITLTTENAPSTGSQLLYQYSSMFN